MSDKINRAADDVCPGDIAYARNTVTTHEVLEIPAEMIGKFCVFAAKTTAVEIRFGTSVSVEVSTAGRSSVASNVLTAAGTEPHIVVPAGGEVHRRLQGAWTHLAHESADTSGVLVFGLAQGDFGAD